MIKKHLSRIYVGLALLTIIGIAATEPKVVRVVQKEPNFPDGYIVFNDQSIKIRMKPAPAEIRVMGGRLMRVDTLMMKLLPMHFYRPANPSEEVLWHRYF